VRRRSVQVFRVNDSMFLAEMYFRLWHFSDMEPCPLR
jgi:hypothetical protein